MSSSFSLFNTSILGMNAQATALSNISENISNSGTIGYKDASTYFLTVLNGLQTPGQAGGGVETTSRYNVASQGTAQATSSSTDLAIQGAGFFVVQTSSGQTLLTREGSFVTDAQGRLVNAAGDYLMGFPAGPNSNPASDTNISNMTLVTVPPNQLYANASTSGTLSVNVDSRAAIIPAANLPSTNTAGAQYSSMTSLTTYDDLGTPVNLNIYYSNLGGNQWEMSVYNAADAAAGGGFPYSSGGVADNPMVAQTLTFSPTTGALTAGNPVIVPLPDGANVNLNVGNSTQLGAPFSVASATVNGNAPSAISSVQVSLNGTLSYVLASGQTVSAYTIGLANVPSPVNLTSETGDTFTASQQSGQIFVGAPGSSGFGTIQSSSLEGSTVDLSTQLSNMIIAQRSFTANSQVFQIASDILQVLNNLK